MTSKENAQTENEAQPRLPRSIWVLGLVSLFMDISSELVHGLLPVFLVSVLSSSYAFVGLIEGIGEGTALLFKVLSGPLSDRLKKRKVLILAGYSLGALSKPLFALAPNPAFVLGARVSDRIGKGVRGAPRDALIADETHESLRGKAFGLRQSLDTVGAFVGPLLAIFLMQVLSENFRMIFWIAMIPGLIAVALIGFGVRDSKERSSSKNVFSLKDIRKFQRAFWIVCTIGAVLQLGRFSEAFLILRAKEVGLKIAWSPLVLVVMNVVYALCAYPAGMLSDRMERRKLIALGVFILIMSDLVLAWGTSLPWIFAGIGLWGLHMALTQGLLSALVADTCPPEYRGTAFGIFNLFSAVALIIGGPVAGLLWDRSGGATTFLVAAAVAFFGLAALWMTRKSSGEN